MADHQATWVRLREVALQRYPDDDMAAEAAARALFDAEEAASYAADLDARAEEQDVLDTSRAATRLRGELREELRAEGSSAGDTEEEYVHLDDADLDDNLAYLEMPTDDLAYLELPTDEGAAESTAEQRVRMALFEMQRRDEDARRLMAAERRATADELRTVAAGRWSREDRTRVGRNGGCSKSVRGRRSWRGCANTNTPCPPTSPTPASQKMPNAANSSCRKHASAVACRHATMAASVVLTRAAPAPSSSR
jgi:hypothetical protein